MNVKGTKNKSQVIKVNNYEQQKILLKKAAVIKEKLAASTWHKLKTGKALYNGTQEIYINAEIYNASNIARLMKIFVEDSYYDDDFPATSERKRIFKTTEEEVKEMWEIIERNRSEARDKGRAERQLSLLMKLVKMNKISIKEAADEADMTEAAFKKLALQ